MSICVARFAHRPTMHGNKRLASHKNPSLLYMPLYIGLALQRCLPVMPWFLIALPLFSMAEGTRENPKAKVQFYTEAYGQIPPSSIPEVYQVFERVLAVADKNSKYWPQLTVINDGQKVKAFVLPDGHIVLSRKTLEVIYKDVSKLQGDTRLAFILGHELAHLFVDDFWQDEVSQALSSSSSFISSDAEKVQDKHEREIRADDLGFLYTILASYPAEFLVGHKGKQENFFKFWSKQIAIYSHKDHPKITQRADFLRERLQQKLEVMEYFNFAVRLSYFGRYEEAIELLQEFQTYFPSREVFNNLAFCYLRMAVNTMSLSSAYQYWLPMVIDKNTQLEQLTVRSKELNTNSAQAQMYLKESIKYLNQSIMKDPFYQPGQVNLAVAYFYLAKTSFLSEQKWLQAKIAIDKARALQPDNNDLTLLKAIILYESGGNKEEVKKTIGGIAELQSTSSLSLMSQYNMMRLLSDGSNSSVYRDRLLTKRNELPYAIQWSLCGGKISGQPVEFTCLMDEGMENKAINHKIPISMWRDLLEKPFTKEEQKIFQWNKIGFSDKSIYYNENYALLANDHIISMIIDKNVSSQKFNTLIDQPQQASTQFDYPRGTLWYYQNWAALIQDERVQEIWINE